MPGPLRLSRVLVHITCARCCCGPDEPDHNRARLDSAFPDQFAEWDRHDSQTQAVISLPADPTALNLAGHMSPTSSAFLDHTPNFVSNEDVLDDVELLHEASEDLFLDIEKHCLGHMESDIDFDYPETLCAIPGVSDLLRQTDQYRHVCDDIDSFSAALSLYDELGDNFNPEIEHRFTPAVISIDPRLELPTP